MALNVSCCLAAPGRYCRKQNDLGVYEHYLNYLTLMGELVNLIISNQINHKYSNACRYTDGTKDYKYL